MCPKLPQPPRFARIAPHMRRSFLLKLLALAVVVALPSFATVASAAQVIRMESITIEGQMQKPQASYILQRSGKVDLGVDVRSLKPQMTNGYREILDNEPNLFRTDRR